MLEGCARTAADGEPQQQARGRSKTSVLAIGLVSRCFCARTERASSCQTQALCADCMFAAAQYPASRARLLNEQHGGLNAHELLGPFTEPAGARLAVDDAVWKELAERIESAR